MSELVSNGDEVWTVPRKELLSWFEVSALNLAPLYAGAVLMALDQSFPGRVNFVWHAIREIQNRLPEALSGVTRTEQFDYGAAVEKVVQVWIEHDPPGVSDSAEAPTDRPLPLAVEVKLAIVELLDGHAAVSGRIEAKAENLFRSLTNTAVPPYVVKAWRETGKGAHKLAHANSLPVSSADEAALKDRFLAFEQALLAIVGRTFEKMDQLDDILQIANT